MRQVSATLTAALPAALLAGLVAGILVAGNSGCGSSSGNQSCQEYYTENPDGLSSAQVEFCLSSGPKTGGNCCTADSQCQSGTCCGPDQPCGGHLACECAGP